jgi:glycosyltransferase involved in cell wall biosynthesis
MEADLLRTMAAALQYKHMRRILYLSFNDPDLSPGVARKEREFCDFMGKVGKEHGIEFKGVCLVTHRGHRPESLRTGDYFEIQKILSSTYRIFSRIPLFCSLFRIQPVYSNAYRLISSYDPDILIWRFNITSVPGVFNPKRIKPRVIFVSEHQAKEIEELHTSGIGTILSPLLRHHALKVLKQVDAVIGVTQEITQYETSLAGKDILGYTFTNGIHVDKYPLKPYRKPAENIVKLLYVGSNTAHWHGLDRLLSGISSYQGKARVELHMAGTMSGSIRKLIKSLRIEHLVTCHGYTTGGELDMLFDLCDCAVGTLGMHRKNLSHGSTLKVREYMARGIPFVISHTDDDIPPDSPFVLMAPPNDTPIDMNDVIMFLSRVHEMYGASLPSEMRSYARGNMDYRAKAAALIEFVTSLSLTEKL